MSRYLEIEPSRRADGVRIAALDQKAYRKIAKQQLAARIDHGERYPQSFHHLKL